GTRKAHSDAPGAEAVKETKRQLGWPEDEEFYVPEEALAHFRKSIEHGEQAEAEWDAHVADFEARFAELGLVWRRTMTGELPDEWESHLPSFESAKPMATRQASGEVLNALAPYLPTLVGGSADLGPSNNTDINKGGSIAPDKYAGRIIHFGVREHAMGATLTGMSLNGGLIPFGGTFMCFSDYMKPAIRLAALSHVQVVYVFTHDSVGLGEDGPTHQPIEQLAGLRAIPNLYVLRPADVHEVREAWRLAILRRHAPTALILTRQKVALIDRKVHASAEGARRGAYVLADATDAEGKTTTPRLVLLSTGSEIALCLEARDVLQAEGTPTRVVSMPCWELFEEQDKDYRESVIPPDVPARLAVEAASPMGWDRYTGERGQRLCLDRFGASAPGATALKELGFNVENVVECARALL
ncbi:MAG: transketolase, partial [Rubrivivax sp.]|nr:transketolase [Pyrinomonadaceae bacterium]